MSKPWLFRKYPRATLFIVVTIGALLALTGFETFLFLFLRYPLLSGYFPYCKPSAVYFNYDRNIIQFMPNCSVYDPELAYLLKPGEFDFCNREYCNHYIVNSKGLRDNEASLRQPEIIFLGDSYTMGWGANQEETFVGIIERQTGLQVLNAGVSSYATAREMMLLERLDTAGMKYLVIQYSNNDLEENFRYIHNNFQLNIMSKEKYESECKRHMNRKRYIPLIFTSAFLDVVKGGVKRKFLSHVPSNNVALSSLSSHPSVAQSEPIPSITTEEESKIFLQILSRHDFQDIALIVLNLSHYTLDSHSFIQLVSAMKERGEYPTFIRQMKLIDASSFLEKTDYYIIDDHLNKSGHQKVAKAIAGAIRVTSK